MSDDSDVLAAGLRELAEHEAPPAGERFEAGLRQALRWEQRRRRAQRRRLVALGCLAAVFVAIVVALAMPASARLLPSPVGGELRRLDAQTSDLQAQLSAQAAVRAQLSRRLAARAAVAQRSPLAARRPKAAKQSVGPSVSDSLVGGLGLRASRVLAEPRRRPPGRGRTARHAAVIESHANASADAESDVAVTRTVRSRVALPEKGS